MNRIGWTDVDGKRDIVDGFTLLLLLLLLVDVRLAAATPKHKLASGKHAV